MNKSKKELLQRKGWMVGSTSEFLSLTPDEEAYIEMKIRLGKYLQETRQKKHLTQVQFAKIIKSSQSRVAKMEVGEPSVSIDLLVRSLFALGTSKHQLAKIID